MALYIPHSIFHLARLLYVRPETFGPYYVYIYVRAVHLTSVYICVFFVQNFGKAGNLVCTLESTWHVPANVTVRWQHRYRKASAISRDDILAMA